MFLCIQELTWHEAKVMIVQLILIAVGMHKNDNVASPAT